MKDKKLIGMVHLPALPGSPAWDGTAIEDIAEMALADVLVLERSGFDGAMVQNSLDRPTRMNVDQLTVALMSAILARVRLATTVTLGVNVVKNDGAAAVAIAAATGAEFVRVKVLTGARVSAEGIATGCAYETMQARRDCGAQLSVWADIMEPTSRSLLESNFADDARDALELGAADAIVVTGGDLQSTLSLARRARELRPDAHVIIGGGVNASSVAEALNCAHTVIVGSALKSEPGIRGRNDFSACLEVARAAGIAKAGR